MNSLSIGYIKTNQSEKQSLSLPERLRQRIRRWYVNGSSRRQLLQLDSRQLKDVGITPRQAMEEAAKPFWKE